MKKESNRKTRSDKPSGRQAAEQPEHAEGSDEAVQPLHQGQGPDFQTQDRRMQDKNKGLKQFDKMNKTPGGTPHQQPMRDEGEQAKSNYELEKE
jgi:hypothetical protein